MPPGAAWEVDEEDGEGYGFWGSGSMDEEMAAAWAVGEAGAHAVCCDPRHCRIGNAARVPQRRPVFLHVEYPEDVRLPTRRLASA